VLWYGLVWWLSQLEVRWPLQLLVSPACRERYSELFRFLLLVKRVQMELHAAWNTQTQSIHLPAQQRALLMPLWRLRAHMAFLIDNLQYYLQARPRLRQPTLSLAACRAAVRCGVADQALFWAHLPENALTAGHVHAFSLACAPRWQADVLDVQWQALMASARSCDDFESLTRAHEQCLAAMHAQCFLQASSVSAALQQIFQLCLALCRMLAYAEAGARAEAAYRTQFATVSREFSRQSAFLFAFLSNMSSPQQSPHRMHTAALPKPALAPTPADRDAAPRRTDERRTA
jgi:gamma-tubulin complex component 4